MKAVAGPAANIGQALAQAAAREPGRTAVVFLQGGRSMSFGELDHESDVLGRGLRELGVRRGTRCALMVRPGPEFLSLTFGLLKLGAVPALVDPGLGRLALAKCLAEAAPQAFIAVPLAHAARLLFGWGRKTLKLKVVVGPRLPGLTGLEEVRRLGAGWEPLRCATKPEDKAAILFTSGSTGPPKGALYTHANFAAQVALLRDHFGVRPGEVDLPTFPLFALFAPALGMTSIIPDMDFTKPALVRPEAIVDPIRRYGVTHLFGSPALLDAVGRWAEPRGVKLPTLRRVVSAGAPVSWRILSRFSKLLATDALIHTPYGATEALPVASIASDEILGETRYATATGKGVCVGKPMPGLDVRVMRVTEDPVEAWFDALALPQGEVGEVLARGPNVTGEYYGQPAATALAKVRFPDGSVGHRMGDLGYFDKRGRLWFCGRKSQRVLTQKGELYTVQVEGVFNAHPAVRRSALVGVGAFEAKYPVVVVELEPGLKPGRELRAELLDLAWKSPLTRCIAEVLFHPSLPVDIRHNAKIFRERLAPWAAQRLGKG